MEFYPEHSLSDQKGSLRLYVTNVNDALQILAAKEYLDDRLPSVFVKL